MSKPNTTWVPRKPPPGTVVRIWQHDAGVVGTFYCHGRVERDGRRTYLVRRENREQSNDAGVVLLREDGSVVRWYSDWEDLFKVSPSIQEMVESASRAAVVHSVMAS